MKLEEIENPSFLKDKSDEELEQLAQQIRDFLIESCAVTGGHIGANLGVVELTLSLHRFYNSPEDKLLFDVGHQAYIHKILTGRTTDFKTLRQYKGLSGFPKMSESEHDVWEAGHSSTSLSAALGMAKARDIRNEKYDVVPIIGDGALTGGMALEALNHIGSEKTKMTIILNDNEMSIAPNVGAIHNMFGRIRTNSSYNKFKYDAEELLERIPSFGPSLRDLADKVKDSLKYLVVDGVFFEELGIKYIGPVDGHNFKDITKALESTKNYDGPAIIHVITKKGKGYYHAENDEVGTWHGLGPYKIETGETIGGSGTQSWSEFVSNSVFDHALEDERIVALTPAMPVGSKLTKFQNELPERFFDVGIAEQHAVTMSAGLAASGMKPYLAIYSTFLQRGYDQVLHDVDRPNLNVFFGIDRSGLVGADGETHHGIFDVSFLLPLPNMTIMMPRDEVEAKLMIDYAVEYDGPIALRYPRGNVKGIEVTERQPIEKGKWEVVHKEDKKDVVIISYGPTLDIAEEAKDMLSETNINVEIVNARFIKPVDEEMLHEYGKENVPMLIVEEVIEAGGLGQFIQGFMSQHDFTNDVKTIAIPDVYIEQGDVEQLLIEAGITSDNIVNTIQKMVKHNG
ncbi:1-deoxy-D-xylulose-5-phosphate synthase [Nosocomiicoccus sp. HMSC067E10]|uniref:1-deoxy-D-xylulose-5-phosphate synthase n=1 Tax=Nosocomiicoccus sp. HMSC067E10 TaxID=1739271 RepID=UPI0008A3F992|nr:1-deoxy-D-xylulose-5-phosphate synthase [Nosocomiicoccus sp. HMSC067E10]OFL47045.1 1-deoxy-D-xylulose-5-phosphate synthase [Nosocomiicoccus sp. HMSC067E10]